MIRISLMEFLENSSLREIDNETGDFIIYFNETR